MQIITEEIGPGKAAIYMEKNVKNRAIKPRALQRLVDQMNDGEWKENTGEAIKFARDGTLIDGQHRLQAVINSGKTFKFLVIKGLNKEVFEVIDTGKARNAGDALHLMGVKNYYNISALIRNYLYLRAGRILNKQNDAVSTSHKIIEAYEEDPQGWHDVNQKASILYQTISKIITQTMIGCYYKFFSEQEPEETEVFFQKLCSGVGISDERDPIAVLRKIFIENAISDKRLTNSAKNAYMIVTWNSHLLGKKYKVIPYNYLKDKFPIPYRTKDEAFGDQEKPQNRRKNQA